MTNPPDLGREAIRIGTLVKGDADPAGEIRRLLPHGFESFQIVFSPTLGDCDLVRLAEAVRGVLDGSHAVLSGIGVYGNTLEHDECAEQTRSDFWRLVEHAGHFGVDLVSGFTGRLRGRSIPDSIGRFHEVFQPLADRAGESGVRIAFENCPMRGSWEDGDHNIAHNPAAWELMFNAVPNENIGLEWEPCHQMCQLIEPLPQLRHWTSRIFHVHGKDATIRRDIIANSGIDGPERWRWHRFPGFGDSNWTDVISELRRHGFSGSIDIEGWHDEVYCGDLEITGQVAALKHLIQCRGGYFVEA